MWHYHPHLLERPVPRYTSYPTAADFSDSVGADAFVGGLDKVRPDTPLSLYVHIPFCAEICWYCGCNTSRSNKQQRLESYLDALHAEVALVSRALAGRGLVQRISFGGGSPNAITPVAFVRLVSDLLVAFRVPMPELSVEIDPRSFGPGWAMTLASTGTRRVSLGVQTFDPDIQAAIGRVQPSENISQVVRELRAHRIESINFDLMYGLPGQDVARLEASIDETLVLRPERIALFGYAHVPDLIARQRQIDATDLPDAATRFAQAALGHQRFLAAGYVPVGFDHYALPGDPLGKAARQGRVHRNFQGFTDDACDVLIGFGASAISCFPDRIIQNEKAAGRYQMLVSGGRHAAMRGVVRSPRDRHRAMIIEDLLCGRTADISGTEDSMRERLTPFLDAGLIQIEGAHLTILDAGRPYMRPIAACFDDYRAAQAGRFSNAL